MMAELNETGTIYRKDASKQSIKKCQEHEKSLYFADATVKNGFIDISDGTRKEGNMLLINKTLLKMSKGLRLWIIFIAILKLTVLVGISMFANSIAALLGSLGSSGPDLEPQLFHSFLAAVIMLLGNLLIGEAEYYCTAKARLRLRGQIVAKVLELDVSDVDRLGATHTINAAVDGVERMQVYYTRYLPGLLYGLSAPIYLFFALRKQCFAAAVELLIFALVIFPLNNIFRKVIDALKTAYWHDLGDLTAYYLESLNSLTTTELFGRGEDREHTLKSKAEHLSRTIISVMKINFSSAGLNELMINTAIFIAAVIVCVQLVSGRIGLVAALTVLVLAYSFFSSVRQLQFVAHDALAGISAAQNVAEILEIDTAKPHSPENEKKDSFDGIRFDGVSFAYKGRDRVLKNIDLEIAHNRTTAIVGESGCGKSTIVSLLLRFYDPNGGKITLCGRDYLSIQPEQLRRQINMVPQSVFIFSGTVRQNLLLANPNAADTELYEVLKQVKLKDWIDAQQDGLDAPVGDAGSRLSGGQRQKIGIARALLCKSEYIIFDEATSSVDEKSENEIWACIAELAQTRTLIIISHRLSTIKNADAIYVIENGRVAEHGSHGELMEASGLYSRLVKQQQVLERQGERRCVM